MSMQGESDRTREFRDALDQLVKLRGFKGPPTAFWQSYLDALVAIGGARFGLIVRRRTSDSPDWRKVMASPANASEDGLEAFLRNVADLCESAIATGEAVREVARESNGTGDFGLAIKLETGKSTEHWVAVFLLAELSKFEVN